MKLWELIKAWFKKATTTKKDFIIVPEAPKAPVKNPEPQPKPEPIKVVDKTPWMKIVESEVDKVKEIPGTKDHPVIIEALKLAGISKSMLHDETAWCAAYAKRIWFKAGIKLERLSKFKAWARDYMAFGVASNFKYGCLCVFERNSPGGDSHVTFGVYEDTDFYWCIGGNQGNQVKLSKYPKRDILAIRWPSPEMLADMNVN